MSIVLVGKGKMLSAMIEGCVSANLKIAGVLRYETVNSSSLQFIKDFISPGPDKLLINRYKLPDLKFKSVNSKAFKSFLIRKNVDIVLVGTWGEKFKKEIIDTPRLATINIHPSLLPEYRGPNPYLETILHGEKESGVTFHLMDENYDSGKILLQSRVPIQEYDTGEDLRNKIIYNIHKLIPQFVSDVSNGLLIPVAQNERAATYYPLKSRENIINFKKQTSSEIFRQVRAFYPWIPCYIELKGKFFRISPNKWSIAGHSDRIGRVIDKNSKTKSITIVCADGIAVRFDGLKIYRHI
ncbi:hypothetical protein J6E39_03550 [bacterium]|nr:hypothetical protein [bacterium]